MKLFFSGADHEVTGSMHMVENAGRIFLVDCGMEQGVNKYENAPLPVPYSKVDFVLVTHAHIDHVGMLPYIYTQGFRGPIYATRATCDLCRIMLSDCAHIQEQETEWKNRKALRAGREQVKPIYTMEDAEHTLELLQPVDYGQLTDIAEGIRVRFVDAGHLLGSASIEIWLKERETEKKIVFSGDIGNKRKPLIRDPQYISEADYVVMESTYGDRLHRNLDGDHVEDLAEIIQKTLDAGGNVVIPAFAVGRTQEMLNFIRIIKEKNLVTGHDNWPVYLDSPMAVAATGVFKANERDCYDEEARALLDKGINPCSFPGLHLSVTSEDSIRINTDKEPKVIISASGMCDAGRIRHHLKHNLWRPECTVLFAGYQAVGTLGRSLLDGRTEVKLFGESIDVEANICKLEGISGHADQNGLLEWISQYESNPEQVFIVHGDDEVCDTFASLVTEHTGFKAAAPWSGSEYDLAAGEFIHVARGVAIRREVTEAARRVNDIFQNLLSACDRLRRVIMHNKGGANRDLEKFTEEINRLSDKWDR